jgi:hypothetical protein
MAQRRFSIVARVSTNSPKAIRSTLRKLVKKGTVTQGPNANEFLVTAEMVGESAKDLNRLFLSELRRVEKRTRLRSEWTSDDGTVQRFFDYVLKKTSRS